jgi:hypothetical protein
MSLLKYSSYLDDMHSTSNWGYTERGRLWASWMDVKTNCKLYEHTRCATIQIQSHTQHRKHQAKSGIYQYQIYSHTRVINWKNFFLKWKEQKRKNPVISNIVLGIDNWKISKLIIYKNYNLSWTRSILN